MPDKMMQHAVHFFGGGGGSSDNGFFVKLPRISRDYLRLQPLRQSNAESGFADSRRSRNNNQFAFLRQGLKFYIITQTLDVFLAVEVFHFVIFGFLFV